MKSFVRLFIPLSLPLLVAACGPSITSGSHMPTPIDVTGRPTFRWNDGSNVVAGDPRLEGNPFFEERLYEAVAWHLALRGVRPLVDGAPAFLVHHHLTLDQHVYIEEIMDDAGVSRVEQYPYERGSVTVHMLDAATGSTVWVGWAEANIEPALKSPEAMRRWVDEVVAAMFEKWPMLSGEER